MFHSLLLGRPLVSCCLHQLVGTCWHPPSTTLHLLFKQVPQAFSIYSVTVFGLMPFKEAWSIWCCAVPCCCSWAWIDNKRLPLKRKLLPNSDPVESIFRNTNANFLFRAILNGILSDSGILPRIPWFISWRSIWHSYWHSIWHIFWHPLSGIPSDIYPDILSGKSTSDSPTDIPSGLLSNISSGILPAILSGILPVSAIYSDILQYLTFFLACVRVRARTNWSGAHRRVRVPTRPDCSGARHTVWVRTCPDWVSSSIGAKSGDEVAQGRKEDRKKKGRRKGRRKKQDAAHEPECSHVCSWHRCRNIRICSHAEHFSAIVYLNSLVHISPVTSLQCGLKSKECGVWSEECKVWSEEFLQCEV